MEMLNIPQADFLKLVDYMHKNYGIDLSKKKHMIEGRLHFTYSQGGYSSFSEYFERAIKDPAQLETLLNKLTTNHTYFMRESAHFDFFKNRILPELEKNKKDKVLSIWSAACSSGEEPYTLSMILKDYFGSNSGWDTRVLATDISQRAMDIAKKATYDIDSLNGLPKGWLDKYFVKNGENCTLIPQIRDNVIFRTFNLMSQISFKKKFDVIFCRNVMIYFDTPTKEALVRRFYDVLVKGGYLIIGHSETLGKENNPYVTVATATYMKP